ncbi:MAG: UDP-N-acetylmuramate dehydrogenase [Clostridia bacterium]|nr:UDP-N-acetylmuramate dehydrogenase [Clostridia bacterium]
MCNHTSFKIGGPASVMVVPETVQDLCEILKSLQDTKYTVMGNGSNLLVSDSGFDGVVVKISGGLNEISVSDTVITVGAGALLSKVGAVAKQNCLTGFEFASGIPGTVGGAVFMNAGAYGGEMKDIVISSAYVDNYGNIGEITEHNFGYRTSVYKNVDKYVVSAKLKLQKGDSKEISDKMLDLAKRRADKQPLEYPSAGSVFKRPEGYFAAALIEQAGLKGKQIGGACVSEKHSGFIVNKGGATCDDVLKLIDFVRETVEKQFGVVLEQEIRLL